MKGIPNWVWWAAGAGLLYLWYQNTQRQSSSTPGPVLNSVPTVPLANLANDAPNITGALNT